MARIDHWPEYASEALALGLFMVSAGGFGILLFHPRSPLFIEMPFLARVAMGIAMGLTAIALIKSPFGQRSGAHMNPAVTLTFHRLGKISSGDAIAYVVAQFIGGALGLWLLSLLEPKALAGVGYVATRPGPSGIAVAFVAEAVISFLLMTVVLHASNAARVAPYTPFLAGACVAAFIIIEEPFSGMSMNPARSFASALVGGVWDPLWIYFVAPPSGMLAAAMLYRGRVYCAKLNHFGKARCIFRCAFGEMSASS